MAYVKITDLNFSQTLTGDEVIPVVQNGTSFQVSVSSIKGGLLIDPRSTVQGYCSTIVAATSSRVDGNRSAIIGGYQNFTTGDNSTVIAGSGNDINSNYSGNLIVGGFDNEITGKPLTGSEFSYFRCEPEHNNILGGYNNIIKDGKYNGIFNSRNTIIGGEAPAGQSIISSNSSNVCSNGHTAGNNNMIIGSTFSNLTSAGFLPNGSAQTTHTSSDKLLKNSILLGGCKNNLINSSYSAIIGGLCNCMIQTDKKGVNTGGNFILGGFSNSLSGRCSNLILGGIRNCVLSAQDTNAIITGLENEVGGSSSDIYKFGPAVENVILGGRYNKAHIASTIIGGNTNYSLGYRSTVIGGFKNCIRVCGFDQAGTYKHIGFNTSNSSTVVGGLSNTITTSAAFIAGGLGNTILVGHDHSAIIGTGITSVSGCMLHANTLFLSAAALPTSDPGVAGVVWRDGTDLKISI